MTPTTRDLSNSMWNGQIRGLGATCNMPTAARILGISRSLAYVENDKLIWPHCAGLVWPHCRVG
jgi:hypothetical protein